MNKVRWLGLLLIGLTTQIANGIQVKCMAGGNGTLTENMEVTCNHHQQNNVTGCCLVEVWRKPDEHTIATFRAAPPHPVHNNGNGPAHPVMQSMCYVYTHDTIPQWCVQARHARPLHDYLN